jgi:hypothetical protein
MFSNDRPSANSVNSPPPCEPECSYATITAKSSRFAQGPCSNDHTLLAAHLMAASKKSVSALQLQRMLGLGSYRTAWFMCHRIREAMTPKTRGPLGGEGKIVEADETYLGGKEKNRHISKRKKGNIGGEGKQAVFALVERDGHSHSFHVANISGEELRPLIVTHVSRKSALMTDQGGQYFHVGKGQSRCR